MAENYQSIFEGERMDELWTLAGTAVQKASVNGQTYTPVNGFLTLPDYPTELTWDAITGKPSWIGSTKPTYTLAELTGDSTHRVVTDAQITAWNGKQDALSNASVLLGITSAKVTAWDNAASKAHEHANKTSVLDKLKWDAEHNAIYIGDEDNPINFYAYGEVAAGGVGSDTPIAATTLGGLLNVTDAADDITQSEDKILVRRKNATTPDLWTLANLSDISGTVVGVRMNGTVKNPGTDKIVDLGTVITSLAGYATETWVLGKSYITASALTPYRTSSAQDAIDEIIGQGLQSLQSQINSLAAKTDFDEINATTLFADTLVASSAIFGSISVEGGIPLSALASGVQTSLGKADTAYGWGDWRTRVGILEGYFTDGSAKKALQLTTARNIWGQSFDGSAAISGDMSSVGKITFAAKTSASTSGNILEVVNIGTSSNPVYALHTTLPFYSDSEITAGGVGSGGGGGGLIETVYGYTDLGGTYSDSDKTNAFNAYTTAKLAQRITALENAPAGGVTSFNARTGAVSLTASDVNAVISYQAPISDLATIRAGAGLGATAVQPSAISDMATKTWVNGQGFLTSHQSIKTINSVTLTGSGNITLATLGIQATISDLATIRTRADEGHTAYGWGNHANAGYLTGITSLMVTTALGYVPYSASNPAGYLVASDLSPIEGAIKSLQSQVDSVSARDGFDELNATAVFSDMLVGTNIYGALHGNADSATNADTVDNEHASAFAHRATWNNLIHSGNEFTYASAGYNGVIWHNYRTASGSTDGNITDYYFGNGKGGSLVALSTLISQSSHGETAYNDLTTVSKAIQSLQSQVDSVASRDFAELAETLMSLKMWIEDMFEKTASGIHAKYNLYSSGEITAGA